MTSNISGWWQTIEAFYDGDILKFNDKFTIDYMKDQCLQRIAEDELMCEWLEEFPKPLEMWNGYVVKDRMVWKRVLRECDRWLVDRGYEEFKFTSLNT